MLLKTLRFSKTWKRLVYWHLKDLRHLWNLDLAEVIFKTWKFNIERVNLLKQYAGQLGYYLGQILNQETQSLLLIDKTSPRHKHENRFKVDGAWDYPVERIRADISDVDLSLVPQIVKSQSIVGTGKHLCGGATGTSSSSKIFSQIYLLISLTYFLSRICFKLYSRNQQ